ncbi:autotransporter assembly complex protein TamA [Sphingomonas morindae]|uniref:BamA/TamA family outer membrane protein n=1 Tax=Sphingomonas morindae TaxID=1541170 RepID=A0ABY4XBS4_9SPHN|nr:BamA/TamA family outer membrane protein [Sphingomonas morindae]USI74412.1 BamA/TamA family outer membrane protein [Sphingomonas morindae]
MSGAALLASSAPAAPPPPSPPQAVDPVGDPQFDAALPPLDAVQAPPAEVQPMAGQAAPAAPETPAPVAAPATSLAATPPAAQPANDPALAEPLPPLAGFDPNPDTSKAKVPTSQAARLRYTSQIEGLKAIGLEDEFRQRSALGKGTKKAANAAQVAARAAEDVALAERLMKSAGYYDGTASSTVLPVPNQAGLVAVTISATPGVRYAYGSITIAGAPPEPTRIARGALPLKPGDPIEAAATLAAEANVALVLPQQGYPFAKTGDRTILLDPDQHKGDYSLPLTAGPRARFGGLRTKGDPVFGLDHLAVFPRFERGQRYDSRLTEDLREALVGTSLFSSVAVEPVDTGQTDPSGDSIVDLLVTQNRGPARALSGSAGYGTGEGVKAEANWTHRNLFPPEGALSVGVIGGTLQQGANVSFIRSNAGQRDRTFTVTGGFNRSNFDAYEAKTINLAATLSRQSTPIWQKRWTWSVGAELVGTNEQGAALNATDDRPRRNYLIGALPSQIQYDRSDSLLNPTRGFRLLARVSPEASLRSGVHGYGRLLGEGTAYMPLGSAIVLAGRVRVASIVGATLEDIAPSRRLYSGGGGSVRGYGFQQLGPKDPQNNPIGGRSQTEFATEVRYRFGNFGIVPFFDGGRVSESSKPGLSDMRYGAGIGARYYTNFGPLRLDVATPINRQPGDSRITLYISIGQAF